MVYLKVSLNKYLLVICCLVHCIWKSWASNKLWPHLIYLTNCSPEVTAFFSLSSTSSSSSTGSSSLSLLSFSSNFLEVSFLAGLPRGRVPGVICGCWGWAWPKINVENYYQKLVHTYKNTNFLVQFGRPPLTFTTTASWTRFWTGIRIFLFNRDLSSTTVWGFLARFFARRSCLTSRISTS